MPTREEWERQLNEEGYSNIRVYRDAPNAFYLDHVHSDRTVHVVLEGSMEFTLRGKPTAYKVGDRFEIPAGRSHSAKIGPEGCVWMYGDKPSVTL